LVTDRKDVSLWTSVYLCPNNFDLYDKDARLIREQTSQDVLLDLIEFTIHMVLERWQAVEKYFGWLIGHREALSDPDAHDSLLFDDDTFSRSRKYFWAINYLAEMDTSIASNIAQLEPWIKTEKELGAEQWKRRPDARSLLERLNQMKNVRARLWAQREEAIALRDGVSKPVFCFLCQPSSLCEPSKWYMNR
jgi:hypothetical protein